jgi:hypothetical protein
MDFILDERARELHWEGHRTDLVVLENSLEKLFMALEGGVAGGSPTQSSEIYSYSSCSTIFKSKLQQNQDTNNFKNQKNEKYN